MVIGIVKVKRSLGIFPMMFVKYNNALIRNEGLCSIVFPGGNFKSKMNMTFRTMWRKLPVLFCFARKKT